MMNQSIHHSFTPSLVTQMNSASLGKSINKGSVLQIQLQTYKQTCQQQIKGDAVALEKAETSLLDGVQFFLSGGY
jgi:hypothetical protein